VIRPTGDLVVTRVPVLNRELEQRELEERELEQRELEQRELEERENWNPLNWNREVEAVWLGGRGV